MDYRNLIPSHPYHSYYGRNYNFFFQNPGEYKILMTMTPSNDQSLVNLSAPEPTVNSTPTSIIKIPSRSSSFGSHVEVPRGNYPNRSQGSPILSGHFPNSNFGQSSRISSFGITNASAPLLSSTLCTTGTTGFHISDPTYVPQSSSSSSSSLSSSSSSSSSTSTVPTSSESSVTSEQSEAYSVY